MKVTTKTVTIETHQLQVSKQDFLDFLDSRIGVGTAKKYAYNVLFGRTGSATVFTRHPFRWLDVAFGWDTTPEGHKFWCAVDTLWSSYLVAECNKAKEEYDDPEIEIVSAEKS